MSVIIKQQQKVREIQILHKAPPRKSQVQKWGQVGLLGLQHWEDPGIVQTPGAGMALRVLSS